MRSSSSINENERLNVGDERLHAQSASVRVCCNRARDRQSIGSCLLLSNSPGRCALILQGKISVHKRWPFNPCVDFQNSALAVQMSNSVQFPDVDQFGIRTKLLVSHRVASATN